MPKGSRGLKALFILVVLVSHVYLYTAAIQGYQSNLFPAINLDAEVFAALLINFGILLVESRKVKKREYESTIALMITTGMISSFFGIFLSAQNPLNNHLFNFLLISVAMTILAVAGLFLEN